MREEYTLVFLTLLVRLGLGTLVVYNVSMPFVPVLPESIVSFSALMATGFGLALSLLHVGKPGRILNTFANRKSAMSWEAILAPLLLGTIFGEVVISYFYETSEWLIPLRIAAFILSIAFIFVTGKVYHLRARPSWSTTLVLYEYFISALILGVLGLTTIYYILGSLSLQLINLLCYLLIVLISAETMITYAYRSRAMSTTVTAYKALSTGSNKRLYFNFVVIGLIHPILFAISLLMGVETTFLVPALLGTFFIGAAMWRVLFFRSATLIKITPDIKI